MLVKYYFAIFLAVLVSCNEKSQSPLPNDEVPDSYVLVGDPLVNITFNPIKKLRNGSAWINDSIIVDSLKLDLDFDNNDDFQLVYVGEYISGSNGDIKSPINESIYLSPLDHMLLRQAHKYGENVYTVLPSQKGDSLSTQYNWLWLENPILFQRKKNGGIGTWNSDKYYISYYKPGNSTLGWFSYRIIFNDYLVDELQIEDFGEYVIPTN